jgi:glutamate dehydrogenase
MLALTINTTDLPPLDRFPEYTDPFEAFPEYTELLNTMASTSAPAHKTLGKLQQESNQPSRHPSPQPTHFSLLSRANGNGHRILRSATVGYVAPEFKGKVEQMTQGEHIHRMAKWRVLTER